MAALCLWLGVAGVERASAQLAPFHAEALTVASSEQRLWVVQVSADATRLGTRGVGEAFQVLPVQFDGRVALATAAGDRLYAFFDDASFYSVTPDSPLRPEVVLPSRGLPWDFCAIDGVVFALVSGATAVDLVDEATPPELRQVSAEDDRLYVIAYHATRWRLLARTATPHPERRLGAATGLQGSSAHPRLVPLADALHVFWCPESAGGIAHQRIDPATGHVAPATPNLISLSAAGAEKPRAFWPIAVNRYWLLALTRAAPDGGDDLRFLRAVSAEALLAGDWTPIEPTPSAATPPAAVGRRYEALFAYNQHLGLLSAGEGAEPRLDFICFGGPTSEPAVTITELFRPDPRLIYGPSLNAAVFMILLMTLGGVFVLRRSVLVQPAVLPPGQIIAAIGRRALAALLDLVPLAALAALLMRLPRQATVGALLEWAFGSDTAHAGVPELATLLWWVYATASYAIYGFVMELLTGRTVGKQLCGLHVTNEVGARPVALQLAVRNGLRVLELLPPLWALAALIALTPKRQRVGDVFARTVVVQRIASQRDSRHADAKSPSDGESDTPPSNDQTPSNDG